MKDSDNINDTELLRYAQEQFYSALIKVLEIYRQLPSKLNLQTTSVATITLETRLFLGSGAHTPNRSKGYNSFLNNVNKEFKKKLLQLPDNPSKADIDIAVSETIKDISKDLYGATAIFHMANDMSEYCESSDDPQVALLYGQLIGIENYLLQSDKISKIHSENKQDTKLIDVSDTFIDSHKNPKVPTKVAALDIKNLNSIEDYYNQLISVLTLLTNASMFEITNSKTGKESNKRIVSELDYSIIEIIHMIETSDNVPKNNLEYIQKIIDLMQLYNFTPHKSFDVQLKEAILAKTKAEKKENFTSPITEKQKERYQITLEHLRRNLEAIKTDRLHNYILKHELTDITKRLCDLPNFKIDIVSQKTESKINGFYSNYSILSVNDLVEFELQSQGEFRAIIAREGNAAHNSTLPGKSFNIMHFFELVQPTPYNKDTNRKLLNLYCNFLNCITYNSVKSKIAKSKADQPYLNKALELVTFVKQRIRIKDDFSKEYYSFDQDVNEIPYTYKKDENLAKEYRNSKLENRKKLQERMEKDPKTYQHTFDQYIKHIIDYYCAKFGDIQANHSDGDHNTIQIKNKTDKDTLLSFLKNRIGLSVLAYMIIDKYTRCSSKTVEETYRTIASEDEAVERMGESTIEALQGVPDLIDKNGNVLKFDSKFHTQGQDTNSER